MPRRRHQTEYVLVRWHFLLLRHLIDKCELQLRLLTVLYDDEWENRRGIQDIVVGLNQELVGTLLRHVQSHRVQVVERVLSER